MTPRRKKPRVQLGTQRRRKVRWYVCSDCAPFYWRVNNRDRYMWLRDDLRSGSPVYSWVDSAGRAIKLPCEVTSLDGYDFVEVHAPGVCGSDVIKDKKMWVSEGL